MSFYGEGSNGLTPGETEAVPEVLRRTSAPSKVGVVGIPSSPVTLTRPPELPVLSVVEGS